LNPQLTLALILLASVALNVGLIAWMAFRGKGPDRVLDVWTGRGWDPVRLKRGERKKEYKRADGVRVTFDCADEWGQPYGKRGYRWLANATNPGDMLKWSSERKAWLRQAPPANAADLENPEKWTEVKLDANGSPIGLEPVDGTFLAVEWQTRPMSPSGAYLATALDDGREDNWFRAHKNAELAGKVKPNWLLIAAAGIAVWFFFIRGH